VLPREEGGAAHEPELGAGRRRSRQRKGFDRGSEL
jgi:hypothetical protein